MPDRDLTSTAYALLSLLTFGEESVTGYELKQRADMTLRFYWTSPAMSQVYSELGRLAERGLVESIGTGRGTRYRISAIGREVLERWLADSTPGFPSWKHPVALRFIVGHLASPDRLRALLREYLEDVAAAKADLQQVRDSLVGSDVPGTDFYHPSLVADWGLAHFDSEIDIVAGLLERLATDPTATDPTATGPTAIEATAAEPSG